MSRQAWTELPTWHGEGEYGGARRCPRCGRITRKKNFDVGEAMDDVFIIEMTCPKCGLEYAMVCQRWGDRPVEGECDECGAWEWEGDGSDVEWPYIYYSSVCLQCGNVTAESTPFDFVMNVVRESEHKDSGFEIVDIEEACDLLLARDNA
jgi:predicted RNA-binding Zn-ribbon protein involved in translation (DUF1610 family)